MARSGWQLHTQLGSQQRDAFRLKASTGALAERFGILFKYKNICIKEGCVCLRACALAHLHGKVSSAAFKGGTATKQSVPRGSKRAAVYQPFKLALHAFCVRR